MVLYPNSILVSFYVVNEYLKIILLTVRYCGVVYRVTTTVPTYIYKYLLKVLLVVQ